MGKNYSQKLTGVVVPLGALYSEKNPVIGCYTELIPFAQFCKKCGFKLIQLLPVNDTGTQSSPYSGLSAFALHPIYIRIKEIPGFEAFYKSNEKFKTCYDNFVSQNNYTLRYDYDRILNTKINLLQQLYETTTAGSTGNADEELSKFIKTNPWIKTYAVYKNLKWNYMQASWKSWHLNDQHKSPEEIEKLWNTKAFRKEHLFYAWCQFIAQEQFSTAVKAVHDLDILLKGDMPILMNEDSCDTWAHPEFFNQNLRAGSPSDGENPQGQNWGFPTYNWKNLKEADYSWWKDRLKSAGKYYDAYRLDHILGFFRIWEIPLQYSSGLMGRFNPARPYTAAEIGAMGFGASPDSFCTAPQGTPETNVLFLEDTRLPGRFHPRINGYETSVFESLPESDRNAYRAIHDDYFYSRNNCFWSEVAMSKLPALIEATDMIVCGEDLGMIPACVPEVMDRLRIMSLEVQRMPKDFGTSVADPATYPYMSVCTPSTHDMSVLRSWIEKEMPRNAVITSDQATTLTCREIIQSHLSSPSILSIFQIQDWMSVSPTLRAQDPDRERINVPANPDNYWRYRMHVSIGKLLESDKFNSEISDMIARTGR